MSPLPFRLFLITDAHVAAQNHRTVVHTVKRALQGKRYPDVAVLLRDKEASVRDVEKTARALLPVVRDAGALLFVHTHASVALTIGADGVHFSSSAPAIPSLRRDAPHLFLGASRHGDDAFSASALSGLDYVFLSPIFAPTSKPLDTRVPLGLSGLAAITQGAARPVFALGGLQPEHVAPCHAAGAAGVAVLGGILAAPNPAERLTAYLTAD